MIKATKPSRHAFGLAGVNAHVAAVECTHLPVPQDRVPLVRCLFEIYLDLHWSLGTLPKVGELVGLVLTKYTLQAQIPGMVQCGATHLWETIGEELVLA